MTLTPSIVMDVPNALWTGYGSAKESPPLVILIVEMGNLILLSGRPVTMGIWHLPTVARQSAWLTQAGPAPRYKAKNQSAHQHAVTAKDFP